MSKEWNEPIYREHTGTWEIVCKHDGARMQITKHRRIIGLTPSGEQMTSFDVDGLQKLLEPFTINEWNEAESKENTKSKHIVQNYLSRFMPEKK